MTSPLQVLILGFLLGLRHALDPDHLVAVTTIVSEYRNPLRAIWVGVSWGLGHTTTLFLVGVFLLLAKVSMPERLAVFFEFVVGIVLVVLGVQIFWSFRRGRVHLHPHEHDGEPHLHFHSHAETPEHSHHRLAWNNWAQFLIAGIIPGEHRPAELRKSLKPFFRAKSYIVGTVHGLAGSAALMLLILASLESQWVGMWYLLLFGLGSVGAMGLATIFLTLPFSVSTRLPRLHRLVQTTSAIFSVLFGLLLMYEAALTA
ncbi:MAG: urease accessory protein UreH [Dehalococcoidia bacterium]|nr:urease accessory protein UreH [Dehalococcoidia bacterium]